MSALLRSSYGWSFIDLPLHCAWRFGSMSALSGLIDATKEGGVLNREVWMSLAICIIAPSEDMIEIAIPYILVNAVR